MEENLSSERLDEIRRHAATIRSVIEASKANFELSEDFRGTDNDELDIWVTGSAAGIVTLGVSLIDAATSLGDGESKRLDNLDEHIGGLPYSGLVVNRDESDRPGVQADAEATGLGGWIVMIVLVGVLILAVVGAVALVRWVF